MEVAMIEAAIIKDHRSAQGARGGLSVKRSLNGRRLRSNLPKGGQIQRRLEDQNSCPHRRARQSGRFVLMPNNRCDTTGVGPLIRALSCDALLADKAFDANWIIDAVNERGARICISRRQGRKEPLGIDEVMYGWRYLVEDFICNLKGLRRIAMRTGKTDTSFSAMINARAALLNSR